MQSTPSLFVVFHIFLYYILFTSNVDRMFQTIIYLLLQTILELLLLITTIFQG